MLALDIRNLTYSYTPKSPPVLHQVNLQVQQHEFVALVGPNGGGKSTLFKLILGLLPQQTGQIYLYGQPAPQNTQIGYMPQSMHFPRTLPISVQEVVMMGRLQALQGWRAWCSPRRWWRRYSEQDLALATKVMQQTEIAHLAARSIQNLSGGQLQRVLLARALVTQPKLLLLDEPTASVDAHMERELFDYLQQINREICMLVICHNVRLIHDYATRVACVNRTLHCHENTQITPELISHMYGQPLDYLPQNSA